MSLPAADNEACHQKDEEDDSPSDGHGQDGGLVRVADSQNICTDRETGTERIQRFTTTSIKDEMKLMIVVLCSFRVSDEKTKRGWELKKTARADDERGGGKRMK